MEEVVDATKQELGDHLTVFINKVIGINQFSSVDQAS